MNKQELDERLQELHNELKKIKSVDEKELQILEQLSADIQDILAQIESDENHPYDEFGERLKSAMEQFAASHPQITSLMGQIADMLARIGI
jgi:uncharacterized protein involved in exopolysaccharide biosynthesis